MSFNVAMLEAMKEEGLDLDACIRILRSAGPDTVAEKRRAWDRERKREDREAKRVSGGMSTGNPPDKGSNERDNLTSKEDLPQEANASLPQGAKPRVLWPCPPNVDPSHWRDFLGNRKRKRCAQTQTALDGVMADIATIADDEWPPGRLVEYAAAKGWASINDPRKPLSGTGHGQRSGQSGWQTAYTANMGVGGHN